MPRYQVVVKSRQGVDVVTFESTDKSAAEHHMMIERMCLEEPRLVEKCATCWGHGLWGIGDAIPMGGMDAGDGMPTIACPECRANPNPMPEEHYHIVDRVMDDNALARELFGEQE